METHHECQRSRPNRAVTPFILRWKGREQKYRDLYSDYSQSPCITFWSALIN